MPEKSTFELACGYVKDHLAHDYTGHDWFHVQRVLKIARYLQQNEGGDLELIELAVVLHDLGDYRRIDSSASEDAVKGSLLLRGIMDVIGIEDGAQNKIMEITEQMRFYGKDTQHPRSLEGKIAQDADWLDSLGAIGVARVFATGSQISRPFHDPKRKPRKNLTRHDYLIQKRYGTSINHFYEKVLLLPDLMNTKTGKELAKQRVKFVENFLSEFNSECEIEF